MPEQTIGDRILLLRRKNRLSGSDISRETGMSKNMLSRLENNQKTELSSEYVEKLATLFQCSCDYLITGKEKAD